MASVNSVRRKLLQNITNPLDFVMLIGNGLLFENEEFEGNINYAVKLDDLIIKQCLQGDALFGIKKITYLELKTFIEVLIEKIISEKFSEDEKPSGMRRASEYYKLLDDLIEIKKIELLLESDESIVIRALIEQISWLQQEIVDFYED